MWLRREVLPGKAHFRELAASSQRNSSVVSRAHGTVAACALAKDDVDNEDQSPSVSLSRTQARCRRGVVVTPRNEEKRC